MLFRSYDSLLEAALRQFFGRATLDSASVPAASNVDSFAIDPAKDPNTLSIRWFGTRYTLRARGKWPFTPHELRLARVIGAVAKGDLSQTMDLENEERPLRGEFLRIGRVVNTMVGQLGSFASEVTRVAREVGTEGKLGGQAQVKGVAAPGRTSPTT